MALTELERQKDSISWEPISERADFITTLSYKRGSTIPWCRTLQKSIIKQDQTLSPHCPKTIQLFKTVSYQKHFTKEYYEAKIDFITTLHWPTNGVQLYHVWYTGIPYFAGSKIL